MNHPPAPRDVHRARRRLGRAVLILAFLAGCAATLVALLALISTTESPVDGPSAPVLAVAMVAAPVVAAVILIARVLGRESARDDDELLP
jgi:Kef-type K+ transport system membrane component KefB